MYVDTILQSKGSVVYTLPTTATLAQAITLLNDHNIGAAVVIDAGNAIVGILSERDIVRRMGGETALSLALPVSEAMTRTVFTCNRQTPIDLVMERMTHHRVRQMPVTDQDDTLIGIVSIGDVVKLKIESTVQEVEELREYIAS